MSTIVSPATGEQLAEVAALDASAVDETVARAARAYVSWRKTPAAVRAKALTAISNALDAHLEEFARLESGNVGKPIRDARDEIAGVVETFRYYAGAPERVLGDTIPVDGGVDMTFQEPLGVVGLITPWNFPLAIAAWKIAPALAAGNAVVLKPAELTPLTALRLCELAGDAGLPEDVFSVVTGSGSVVGQRLVEHPGVAKIAFTGSTEVGSHIAATAARQIKRVSLELGGKSASVVFADADLERAAKAAPAAVFGNAGQDCCARARILVEASVFDRFISLFEKATHELRIGDPADERTDVGPLISAEHRERVASFLDDDVEVLARAKVPAGSGHWFEPSIVRPRRLDARAMTEEIFGPVAAVVPFHTEEEAVQLANNSIYGLSGSIWTRDVARALRVAREIESGTLSVNSNTSVRVQTPFGGMKQSGIGRELGPHALREYTETKNVFIDTR
jgi:betaine-aldehyde dehydrogenase